MKKVIFGLIATVFLSNLSVGQNIDINNPDNYGAIHNEIVSSFKKAGKTVSQYSTKELFIEDIYKLSVSKYPQIENFNNVKGLSSNFFTDFKKPDFDTNLNQNITRLYQDKKISKILFDNLKIIIAEKSFDKSIEIINNLEKVNLDSNDKLALKIFKSVLISSNQYWSSTSSTARIKYCREIADGLGALIWFYSGPFSIVAGVVYSIAVEEGGGCN